MYKRVILEEWEPLAPIFFDLRSLPTVAINGHDLRSWLMYGLASIVNMLIVNMLNAAIVNMLIDSSCNTCN